MRPLLAKYLLFAERTPSLKDLDSTKRQLPGKELFSAECTVSGTGQDGRYLPPHLALN